MKSWIVARKYQIGTILVAMLLIAATATTTTVLTGHAPKTVTAAPDEPVRVAVIGDSYSAGFRNDVVWPSLFAASSQLSISNAAYAGTGYVGGAGQNGPFAQQVDKALASRPAIIVVFGGMSDAARSDDLITQSVTDLLTELTRRAPAAKVVVLGPIWHQDPVPDSYMKLDAAVGNAANTTHTTYIRLIDENWLVGDGLIQDDDFTPTDAGQLILAGHLGPILLSYIRAQDRAVLP